MVWKRAAGQRRLIEGHDGVTAARMGMVKMVGAGFTTPGVA